MLNFEDLRHIHQDLCNAVIKLKYRTDENGEPLNFEADGGLRDLAPMEEGWLETLNRQANVIEDRLISEAITTQNHNFLWNHRAALSVILDEDCGHGPEMCLKLRCADRPKLSDSERDRYQQVYQRLDEALTRPERLN